MPAWKQRQVQHNLAKLASREPNFRILLKGRFSVYRQVIVAFARPRMCISSRSCAQLMEPCHSQRAR